MTRTLDTLHRTELTGPWAGFGFQAGHFWTPEGHTLYPDEMRWWSLTCNIAREWRLMMEAERERDAARITATQVIWLRERLLVRRERCRRRG